MFLIHIPTELILFTMLYGGAGVASLIACIYLCLRKGNAFAADVTPPVRLRYWAAALFALFFMGHIWWYLFYIFSGNIHSVSFMLVSLLDCVGLLVTIPGTLFAMLQDRKRPVWPIVTATIPYAVLMGLNAVSSDNHFLNIAIVFILMAYVAFTIYMGFAVRQYGRWLRDNYADLEHKEVWLSHVLIIVLLMLIIIYGFDGSNMTISYIVQFTVLALIGLLTWRVETLPKLEVIPVEQLEQQAQLPLPPPSSIEQLLAEHCVGTQLYHLHQRTPHQPLHESLPRGCRCPEDYYCTTTGQRQWLPELQHFQPRLQAAHGTDGNKLDARNGKCIIISLSLFPHRAHSRPSREWRS